jgi:hypothetical protein
VVEAELEETVAELVAAEVVAEVLAEVEAEIEAELEAEIEAELEVAAVAAEAEAEVEALAAMRPETPVDADGSTPAAPTKRRAQVAGRRVRAAEVMRGRRFLVEYRLERVVRAVDIHDALRQASSLGATQLTAITRED